MARSKKRYSHALTIAFEVESAKEDGSDITVKAMRTALLKRIISLDNSELPPGYNEWAEACLPPYDTYKIEA